MDSVGAVPAVHGVVVVHEGSQVILSLASITSFSVLFGKEDITTALAGLALITTNVWPWVVDLDLTPALLLNFRIRLLGKTKTSVGALSPFVLNLLEMLPLGQIIKLVDSLLGYWVFFGTIVKGTWAIALIG